MTTTPLCLTNDRIFVHMAEQHPWLAAVLRARARQSQWDTDILLRWLAPVLDNSGGLTMEGHTFLDLMEVRLHHFLRGHIAGTLPTARLACRKDAGSLSFSPLPRAAPEQCILVHAGWDCFRSMLGSPDGTVVD